MDDLIRDVTKAKEGDLEACGRLVQNTQAMVYGVAFAVLRDAALAEDAAQESYLRAFHHLHELSEPAAFMAWLRRIAVTVAMNIRRLRRTTLLRLDDVPEVPILDETESEWSELQRQHLAAALLTLTPEERRICDRRYYGHWSVARLAEDAGVDEATFRKRLQRIRDRLRKEIEMRERRILGSQNSNATLPTKIVELLARPRLIDLPENPVGKVLEILRGVYPEFADIDLPEVLDFVEAGKTIGDDALYLDPRELHELGDNRILRYDMTLPFLLTVMSRPAHGPVRLWSAGKVYRLCQSDSQHLEAFHQAEALWIDEVGRVDPWLLAGRILKSVESLLPGSVVRIVPTQYPMCSQAWELEIEHQGEWSEVMAWGSFTDKIVSLLGVDPSRYSALGVCYGLERFAMLRYDIDDIRKLEAASVS